MNKKTGMIILCIVLMTALFGTQGILAATVYGEGSNVWMNGYNANILYGTWEMDPASKIVVSKTYSTQQLNPNNLDVKNGMILFDRFEDYTMTFDLEVPMGPIGTNYTNIILKNIQEENKNLVDWGVFLRFGSTGPGGDTPNVVSSVLYQVYGTPPIGTPVAIGPYFKNGIPSEAVSNGNEISIRATLQGDKIKVEYKEKSTGTYKILYDVKMSASKTGLGYAGISTQNVPIDNYTGETLPVFRNFTIVGSPVPSNPATSSASSGSSGSVVQSSATSSASSSSAVSSASSTSTIDVTSEEDSSDASASGSSSGTDSVLSNASTISVADSVDGSAPDNSEQSDVVSGGVDNPGDGVDPVILVVLGACVLLLAVVGVVRVRRLRS
jgi:hypothetical protein